MPRRAGIQGARFTCWLSERERNALDELADREDTSVNYIVRSAVRQYLQRRGLLPVTTDTETEGVKAA